MCASLNSAPTPAVSPSQPTATQLKEDPPFGGWDVARIALVAILALALFTTLAELVALSIPGQRRRPLQEVARSATVIVPAETAAYMVLVGFMYSLLTRRYTVNFWRALRWNWPGINALGFALAGGALALAVQISSHWLPIPRSLPVEEFFRSATAAYLMSLFGILVAPFVEETFFRGFLYPVLARRWGVLSGTLLTSLAVSLIDQGQLARAWAPLLLLFIVGLALTLTRAATRSLASSVMMHTGYNTTLFLMLYLGSDHFRHFEKLAG